MPIPFEKSFSSIPKHIHWSKNNKKQPSECRKSSNKKYLFDCEKCFHEFEISLNSITNSNHWCGFCSNPPKQLCNNENCETCFNKSFSSHPRNKNWSSKNDNTPREYFKFSHSKCLFDCEKCGNEFESILYNITRGYWCPKCVKKSETKLYEIMIKIYQSIITQFKQDWCKNVDNNYYLHFYTNLV